MGPCVGPYFAAGALLDIVVTDGLGGHDGALDFFLAELFQPGVFAFVGVVCPHSGVAVGLQFDLYCVGVCAGFVVVA